MNEENKGFFRKSCLGHNRMYSKIAINIVLCHLNLILTPFFVFARVGILSSMRVVYRYHLDLKNKNENLRSNVVR